MNFQILSFFLLFFILLNIDSIHAEETEFNLENLTLTEQIRSTSTSKIHPLLIQWQLSDTPNEFAKKNNLSYTENKIGVYIHLESIDSVSKIQPEINVITSDKKIVVAFVSSE